MKNSNHGYSDTLQIVIVVAAVLGAVIPSVFSLTNGIYEVFPFLYILPIILVVYFYPRRGVIFSLGISLVYIGLVYYFGRGNAGLIATSTAWFVIFITIGIVASSYANRLRDEAKKIQKIFETAQDAIFCFDQRTKHLWEINPMCARMLLYEREELIGRDVSVIWPNGIELSDFIFSIQESGASCQRDVMLLRKDGKLLRCLVSAITASNNRILCSASDLSGERVAEEEIRETLEELDRQVRERTADLEKINSELKAEILERRRFEHEIISSEKNHNRVGGGN